MYTKIFSFICLVAFVTAIHAEECAPNCKRYCCRGQSSAYGSNYSLGASMLTWGVLLFVGIGLVTALIEPSLANAHSTSGTTTNPI